MVEDKSAENKRIPRVHNYIEPRTSWSTFSRQQFRINYLVSKLLYFYSNSPLGAINFKAALVQTVLRFRPGDKSFSKRMKAKFTDAYMCHSASMRSLTHWFLAEGPGLLKIMISEHVYG